MGALAFLLLSVAIVASPGQAARHRYPGRGVRALIQHNHWAVEAQQNLSKWRSSLFSRTEAFISANADTDRPSKHWSRFEVAQPYISCPPGRPLRRIGGEGNDDAGKWLCDTAALRGPCTVISAGSFMDFRFEEAMLAETPCDVITLDCTCDGRILSDRHTFRKVCVGSAADAARHPGLIANYEAIVQSLHLPPAAGHPARSPAVPLLKIDVEASEFPFFADWHELSPNLPEQIAVEVHLGPMDLKLEGQVVQGIPRRQELGALDVALFFGHLANLGYGVVSSEINQWSGLVSEFTLFRVEAATAALSAATSAGAAAATGLDGGSGEDGDGDGDEAAADSGLDADGGAAARSAAGRGAKVRAHVRGSHTAVAAGTSRVLRGEGKADKSLRV